MLSIASIGRLVGKDSKEKSRFSHILLPAVQSIYIGKIVKRLPFSNVIEAALISFMFSLSNLSDDFVYSIRARSQMRRISFSSEKKIEKKVERHERQQRLSRARATTRKSSSTSMSFFPWNSHSIEWHHGKIKGFLSKKIMTSINREEDSIWIWFNQLLNLLESWSSWSWRYCDLAGVLKFEMFQGFFAFFEWRRNYE